MRSPLPSPKQCQVLNVTMSRQGNYQTVVLNDDLAEYRFSMAIQNAWVSYMQVTNCTNMWHRIGVAMLRDGAVVQES